MKAQLRQFFFGSNLGDNTILNTGWLLFRLHMGLSIAVHAGWPKMNAIAAPGWFTEQVAGLGFTFPSPGFWAAMASWGEFIGGICIALGLLTRFASLQLAFQFFVISFLWYDKPEPVTGMYFQQTLFWGYVLLAIGGSGRFAIDRVILSRKKLTISLPVKTVAASLLLLAGTGIHAQTVTKKDFTVLEGKWKGTLTYLDYTSNKDETIKSNAIVEVKKGNVFTLGFYYTDEPKKGGKDRYRINAEGTMINNMKVIERTVQPDGGLKIVLESRGTDGNDHKAATFHHVLLIEPGKFSMSKLVRFDGEADFFRRNEYLFIRN
jgi:uncharacterized membrane protein YphA (DoxX/SURF4 family)